MHQVRTLLYLSVCLVDWSALEKIKDNDINKSNNDNSQPPSNIGDR